MRNHVLASLVGHLAVLLGGHFLALQVERDPPAMDAISVSLATLPDPTPPTPEPEPEPEPVPLPPAETSTAPPALQADPAPPEAADPAPDLVPPDPDLPAPPVEEDPVPEEPEPEPEVDLPEPEPVVSPPREETPPDPDPGPVAETSMPRAGEEAVDAEHVVDIAAPEGVDDYYLALMRRKIGRRWQPTRAAARGRNVECVVSFRVGPAGDILAPTVSVSSGLSVFDRAALRAVIDSNPLPKPPPRFPAGFPIEFVFSYRP